MIVRRDPKDERIIRAIDRILSGRSWDTHKEATAIVSVDLTMGCAVDVTIHGMYVLHMKKNKDTGTYHGMARKRIYSILIYRRVAVLAQEYGFPMPIYGGAYVGAKNVIDF